MQFYKHCDYFLFVLVHNLTAHVWNQCCLKQVIVVYIDHTVILLLIT